MRNVGGEFFKGGIAEIGVGGDATSKNEGIYCVIFCSEGEFFEKIIDGGFLEAGRKISDLFRSEKGF